MTAPTPYVISYDFTAFQVSNPITPLPADKIEIELNNIVQTTDDLIANLAVIQRSDTQLTNGIVSFDALSNTVKALLGSAINPLGDWATTTSYEKLDLVNEDGSSYICAVDHTSGVFATDFAAGKWVIWAAGDSGSISVNNTNWSGEDLSVANGGSGRSSATAYGVVIGGTTATSAHQSVAVGTAGQVLMSNGPGAAPSMQTILIDEDNMATNSSSVAPTQQSVKAYVDNEVGDLVIPEGGIANAGYIAGRYYWGAGTYEAGSGTAYVANRLYFVPFIVGSDVTMTKIGINVTSGHASSARLGIYTFENGIPTTKILDAGEVSVASTGEKEATISQALTKGIYIVAVVFSGTPSVTSIGGENGLLGPFLFGMSSGTTNDISGGYGSHSYAELPSTFPGSLTYVASGNAPSIWMRP